MSHQKLAEPKATTVNLRAAVTRYVAEKRRSRPRYSLRLFAKQAGLNPTTVSLFLARKRRLSADSAKRLGKFLGLSSFDQADEVLHFDPQRSKDWQAVASKWHDFALLSLMETTGFHGDAATMSKRLDLPLKKVRAILNRLTRLGLVANSKGHGYQLTGLSLQFGGYGGPEDLKAIRRAQFLSGIEKVRKSLQANAKSANPLPNDYSIVMMAIDPKKVALVRDRIAKFRRNLSKALESGSKREVYFLAIQLLPISVPLE